MQLQELLLLLVLLSLLVPALVKIEPPCHKEYKTEQKNGEMGARTTHKLEKI